MLAPEDESDDDGCGGNAIARKREAVWSQQVDQLGDDNEENEGELTKPDDKLPLWCVRRKTAGEELCLLLEALLRDRRVAASAAGAAA